MDLGALRHLAWSKTEAGRHRFNLAESAVAVPDLEALGLPSLGGLPRQGYAAQETLERALGARMGAPGDRVLLTAGASEANAIVFGALLDPGDEVLVESPGYQPHRDVPPLFGIRVRRFARPLGAGDGALGPALETVLTPATRMVVLSHLHNPSGEALSGDDADRLDRLARDRGLWILCDETFREADATLGPGTLAARGGRWVATGSLTKAYGLGGLRLGWIAAGEETRARGAVVQNALSVLPALPSVALALDLVPHLETLLARSHRILAANGARWRRLLDRGVPCRVAVQSRGTTSWCLFAGAAAGDAFAEYASRHHDLAVTPGSFFGEPAGVRVALGAEPAVFEGALAVLARALDQFVGARGGALAPRAVAQERA